MACQVAINYWLNFTVGLPKDWISFGGDEMSTTGVRLGGDLAVGPAGLGVEGAFIFGLLL